MAGVPTLTEVRAWVNVPATSVSDADLSQILAAELAIQAGLCRVPPMPNPGPVTFTVVGYDATISVVGGIVGTSYHVSWGDGATTDVALDDTGAGTASHTYVDDPGQYPGSVTNTTTGATTFYVVTVPGDGSVNPDYDYPDALSRACLRRCQRQVAARNVPLGVLGVESDGFGPINLPSWDAEIARLEASYRIPVIA